jgi:hypothetical protein
MGESSSRDRMDELSNLQKFEQVLPAHDDIPLVIEQLFELAIEERLVLYARRVPRAERRRGTVRAIPHDDAGQGQRRLRFNAFSSVHSPATAAWCSSPCNSERDRIQAEQIEALVQWTLITGSPGVPAAPTREASRSAPMCSAEARHDAAQGDAGPGASGHAARCVFRARRRRYRCAGCPSNAPACRCRVAHCPGASRTAVQPPRPAKCSNCGRATTSSDDDSGLFAAH